MYTAPVLIPTCNRIEHLKRCINSIARNKQAIETELFISVDFPPSDKYQKGYQEVVDYVRNEIDGFKDVQVYIQKHNLGPSRNIEFLYSACKRYDRWILTEDDNEFSANFLEYMNSGLEYFQDDQGVLFICACTEGKQFVNPSFNCYTSSYFQPYGCASWRKKYDCFLAHKEEVILDPQRMKLKNAIWMYRRNPWCFRVFVNQILLSKEKKDVFWRTDSILNPVDGVIQLFLLFDGEQSMFPVISKSRTCGNDGSGFTMVKEDIGLLTETCKLDTDDRFVMKLCDLHDQIPENKNEMGWKNNLKLWIKYLIYRLSHGQRKYGKK